MRLRPLVTADLDRVLELEGELFGLGAWTIGMFTDELSAPGRRYLVADDGGAIVGYAGIMLGLESHIMTIGVAPAARRRGIGTALLTALLSAAREAGAESVILEVRADEEGPQRLYSKFGFATIGVRPGYYQLEGADAVVMRADLNGAEQ